MVLNCRYAKVCGFCKNYYDPANETIKPRPGKDFFEIDIKTKRKCMVSGLMKCANNSCNKFERKI